MRHQEFKNRFLVGVYLKAKREGLYNYYDAKEIADDLNLDYSDGEVWMAADSMTDVQLYVSATMGGGADENISVQITSYGLEEAEQLLEQDQSIGHRRIAQLDPETKDYAELVSSVDSLLKKISQQNDVSTWSPDEQEQVAKLQAGRALLEGPQVSVELLERVLLSGLKGITNKAAEKGFDMLVTASIAGLSTFLMGVPLVVMNSRGKE